MHQVAFEIAQIYAKQSDYSNAVTFFNLAIQMANSIIPPIDAKLMGSYYMHRAAVYEALGMTDHARLDYQKITDADPIFYQRYHD